MIEGNRGENWVNNRITREKKLLTERTEGTEE